MVATTLVKPGIRILEREAQDLGGIRPIPASSQLHTYLGLFAPITELSQQLLAALEASDGRQSRKLELLIAELSDEQTAVAESMGFHSCSIGFTMALGGAR
ncbi:MAG: hypothetical protein ACTHN3_07235 [Solirubrobacterales bacterium]